MALFTFHSEPTTADDSSPADASKSATEQLRICRCGQGEDAAWSTALSPEPAGQVVLLRFRGHGLSDTMVVSSGRMGGVALDLNYRYRSAVDNSLKKVQPTFTPFGSTEFHGCRVGSGSAGRNLPQHGTNAMRIPATGAFNAQ